MTRRGGGNTDHQARYNIGALEQRVYGLEQGVAGLSSQISGLSQQIAASGKTNWSVIIGFGGIALSFMIAIGGMAYWPIREAQGDLKVTVVEMNKANASAFAELSKAIGSVAKDTAERYVTVRELDARAARTQTDIARILQDIKSIEDVNVPRVEQQERARTVDTQIAGLQRQIDDLKRQFGDTFRLRDALQQMQREIDLLRAERRPA